MAFGECPACGRTYAKPRRAPIAIHREAGYTYLIAPKRLLAFSRRIVHECRPDLPPAGGTSAMVPAIPPTPRPSRENAIALDIPGAEAIAG
jgi:hypothetical protein